MSPGRPTGILLRGRLPGKNVDNWASRRSNPGMLATNESETLGGDTRSQSACGTFHRPVIQRFVVRHASKGRSATILGRLAGWWRARYIVRVDAALCPGGRLSATSLVSLIDSGEDIKTSSVSDVYRTQWGGRDVVVKRYNHMGLTHSLRHSIKGSRARRSWRNGQRLLELGIPTPRPLAHIDEYRGLLLWRSYLVTAFVDGRRLSELLEDEDVPPGAKRRMVTQVLKLIHRLSVHGINHGDMKHTNILCLAGKAVLTDLDSVETHEWEWLHRRRQAVDLARFLRDISGPSTQWELAEASTGPSARAAPMRRQDFVSRTTPTATLCLNTDYRGKELEEALLAGQEGLRQRYAAALVESARSSRIVRFETPRDPGGRTIYLKEYLDRSPLDWLKRFLRRGRAVRAFDASLMLAEAGFLTPTIVAAGQVRRGLLGRRSFLATEAVEGTRPIHEYLIAGRRENGTCSLHDRRKLLRAIGQIVGQMHRMGIVHGDLRPGNILVRKSADRWEFFFIDNERTCKRGILSAHLRIKNLVQINMLPRGLSRTDRMRFFQSYMLANPSVCAAYKRWARRIMAITYRRFRRKGWVVQRRGGPSRVAVRHG